MGQIITGLIIAAVAAGLWRSNNRFTALAAGLVAIFLIWPGSGHIMSILLGQALSLAYFAGPAIGMIVCAIVGLRLMLGRSALPRRR